MTDWTHVQSINSQSPAGNTLTKAFGAAVTSGDVVVGGILLDTGYTATLTDNQGNGYTVFDAHDDGTLYTAAFVSNGLITNAPTTLIYTAHGPATTVNFWIAQSEFTPPTGATSPSQDGSASTFNSAGTSFTGFSTSLTDDLVYAVAFSSGAATHGSGFNAGAGDGTAVCSEWGIQSSAGSVNMNLASQTGSFWGPAFAVNAGTSPPSSPQPAGVIGLAACEW